MHQLSPSEVLNAIVSQGLTNYKVKKLEQYKLTQLNKNVHIILAPVCNPTLQVIGLHRPCIEKAGVAINALQLYLTLKY